MATAGALDPTLTVFMGMLSSQPLSGRTEAISSQNITGRCAIAREIFGEKKQPGRRVVQLEKRLPTGRESPKTLGPTLTESEEQGASFRAFAGGRAHASTGQNITGCVWLQEKSAARKGDPVGTVFRPERGADRT